MKISTRNLPFGEWLKATIWVMKFGKGFNIVLNNFAEIFNIILNTFQIHFLQNLSFHIASVKQAETPQLQNWQWEGILHISCWTTWRYLFRTKTNSRNFEVQVVYLCPPKLLLSASNDRHDILLREIKNNLFFLYKCWQFLRICFCNDVSLKVILAYCHKRTSIFDFSCHVVLCDAT
jgi:hypothetical protein